MRCAAVVRRSVLSVAALGAAAAYADAVCEKGFRDTTAAERQTMLSVMGAAQAALPPAPTGWVIGGYEELSPVNNICKDEESTPWAYTFSRTYNRTDNAAEREAALAAAAVAARAAQAARQPRLDALQVKIDAATQEFAAAAQSGDQARIAASQRALDAVSAESAALFAEADPQALASIIEATERDVTMSIVVEVNPGGIANPDMQSVAPLAAAQSAYRWTDVNGPIETANLLLLYGAWQPREAGGVTSVPRGTASSAAAHAIAVRVAADPGRIDSLLGAIDSNAIAALTR